MYKKRITLTEIKQEAKDLKQSNPNLKHTQALNKVAQKYGYEKFEILKVELDKQSYIEIDIDIDITEPVSFLNKQISEDTFNPLSTEGEGACMDMLNAPTPDIEFTEDMVKATLANFGTKIILKVVPLENYVKENQQIAIIGGSGAGKTTLLFNEYDYLDRETTLIITPTNKNSLSGHPYPIEKDSYFKSFGKAMPVFKKATFKTFYDTNIDFSKFKTIIIEEALMLKTNSSLLLDIKKIIAGKSKAVILTFQEKEACKELGLALHHKEDLREYGNRRSTPLNLFDIYVGDTGMSYFEKA